MSTNRSRLEANKFKLTVLRLAFQSGEAPVDDAEVDMLDVWHFEDRQRYAYLAFLDHEWTLFIEVGTKEIRIY